MPWVCGMLVARFLIWCNSWVRAQQRVSIHEHVDIRIMKNLVYKHFKQFGRSTTTPVIPSFARNTGLSIYCVFAWLYRICLLQMIIECQITVSRGVAWLVSKTKKQRLQVFRRPMSHARHMSWQIMYFYFYATCARLEYTGGLVCDTGTAAKHWHVSCEKDTQLHGSS